MCSEKSLRCTWSRRTAWTRPGRSKRWTSQKTKPDLKSRKNILTKSRDRQGPASSEGKRQISGFATWWSWYFFCVHGRKISATSNHQIFFLGSVCAIYWRQREATIFLSESDCSSIKLVGPLVVKMTSERTATQIYISLQINSSNLWLHSA